MATITGRNNQAAVGRPGVVVYNPARRVVPPTRRTAAPPQPRPNYEGLSMQEKLQAWKAAGSPSSAPSQDEEENSNPFGRGLGFLINNPVTQTVLKPLEVLDYGRRAVTLGMEEFAEGITGQELKATEGDTRSNMEKLKDPTYGVGQLLGGTLGDITPWEWDDKWVDRVGGFVGDLAFDPLTWLTAGAGSIAGKSARAGALPKLLEAQRAAEAAGDTARIAALGGREAIERLGQRGLGTANAAQNAAMELPKQGMRFAGIPIPKTEGIARAANEAVGVARRPMRAIPGAATLRKAVSPKGYLDNDLNPALERIITGKGPGSIEGALETVAMDNWSREAGRGFNSVAKEELERASKRVRDLPQEEISDMVRRAEELGETNIWTETADKMREVAAFYGAELPELQGGRYVMPHVLSREFRNYVVDNADDAAVKQFKSAGQITEQDLLEESGFLQRRAFRPNEDGSPATIPIGGTEVTVETGSVDELNRVLSEAFPGFSGEIYEVNPITAYRHYIEGVSKDVAKRSAGQRAVDAGFENVRRTGAVPENFDPYGVRQKTGLFDKNGRPIERVSVDPDFDPATPASGFAENDFYRGVEDKAATAARDKQIVRSQKPIIEQYRIAGEAERAAIARQLEANAEELLGPLRAARRTAADAKDAATKRMNQARAQGVDAGVAIDEARAGIDDVTAELERLRKAEYGIERTARERTAREQKRLLDGLNDRREALTQERAALQQNYRTLMDTADQRAAEAGRRTRREAAQARQEVYNRQARAHQRYQDAEAKVQSDWQARYGKRPPTGGEAADARRRIVANQDAYSRYQQLTEQLNGINKRIANRKKAPGADWPEASAQQIDVRNGIVEQLNSPKMKKLRNDIETVNQRRNYEAMVERSTAVERGARNEADRAVDDLAQATREVTSPVQGPARPVAAITAEEQKAYDAAQKVVNSKRGTDLEVARGQKTALERQVGKRTYRGKPNAASEKRLAKEIEAKTEEVSKLEGRGFGKKYDDARATISSVEAKQAATPIPPGRTPVEHPLVQGAERKAEQVTNNIAAVEERINQEMVPQIAQAEMAQDVVSRRIADIGANTDEQFTDIGARNRERAADKIEAEIDPKRRAAVQKQREYDDFIEEADARTGDAYQAYMLGMEDQAAMRAEHEALAKITDPFVAKRNRPSEIIEGARGGQAAKSKVEAAAAEEIPFAAAQPLHNSVLDHKQLIEQYPPGLDDPLVQRMEAALFANERQLEQLTTHIDIPLRDTEGLVKAAANGELAPVIMAKLKDDWRVLYEGGDIVISKELDRIYRNLEVMGRNPKAFGRTIEAFTSFFKTYATLTPGFHVRNAMSAVFMNTAEGVPFEVQRRGLRLWREYAAHPEPLKFLMGLPPAEQGAFRAAFASGTGGRFLESGFADATRVSGKLKERIFDNRATRLSQRVGQDWVEGPVRLGLALDTIQNGGDVQRALQRISRIHFDYSQVSQFDETMKRVIPFWTFMSRNLPMQITEMWTKPRTYAQYNSFIRNFRGEDVENTPEYFGSVGAFPFADTQVKGMPLFLQPDFAHTRLEEDVKKLEDLLSGENIARAFSDVNPLFTAPIEYATGQNLYTGRQYDELDYVPAQGIVNKPIGALSGLLGMNMQGASGQQLVPEKFIDLLNSLNPVMDRTSRVMPQLATGDVGSYEGRQLESVGRLFGAPVRTLSPQQQESTRRGQYYDAQDEAALARFLAQN